MQLQLIILLTLLLSLHPLSACKQIAYYGTPTDYEIVEAIPMIALEVCYTAKINGTINSYTYMCGKVKGELQFQKWYKNTNCTGEIDDIEYENIAHSNQYTVDCTGNICEYAMGRYYFSSGSSCDNTGDYMDVPYPVNYCIATEVHGSGTFVDGIYYLSTRCTNKDITNKLYGYDDCSGTPFDSDVSSFIDDTCNNSTYLEVTYCTGYTDESIPESAVVFEIIYIAIYSLSIIILMWIFMKIYKNLFECERKNICCILQFSDRHTWIIEPSQFNKICALIASLAYVLHWISVLIFYILDITPVSWVYVGSLYNYCFSDIFICVAKIFHILFMTSTLEYLMNSESFIKVMISKKLIIFIKIFYTSSMVLYFIADKVLISFYGIDVDYQYLFIVMIPQLITDTLFQICLLYSYYAGLNNVAHYWYSKQWEEYDQYGENEKIHEILINITRVTVIVSFSTLVQFLNHLSKIIMFHFYLTNYFASNYYLIFGMMDDVIYTILQSLYILFIYPFGHVFYEKICRRCHDKIYKYFKRIHQKQVQNNRFDGEKYMINWCCSSKQNKDILLDQIN